jgi:hypothetical protein
MRLLSHQSFAPRIISVAMFFLSPSLAAADGGTIRLSEHTGNYQITVFSAPTPARAGPVDVSVFIQDAVNLEPVSDVLVKITATRRGSPDEVLSHAATTDAATNKLYRAAIFALPEPGWYSLEVSIDGVLGKAQAHFMLEAAEPLPEWLAMWPWVGWPVVAILLFGGHQFLVRRRLLSGGPRQGIPGQPCIRQV